MRTLTIVIVYFFSLAAFCQREANVKGEYTYRGPETVSVAEAKRIALERAKIQAVADEFGTTVTSATSTSMVTENGRTDSKVISLGGSDVKGEWIGTEKEEVGQPMFVDGMIVVTAKVYGRAREIVNAAIQFDAKLLRNAVTADAETDLFYAGDQIFLRFTSPADGYVAVYLVDENDAYCLLPYADDTDGKMPVRHGQNYCFFSEKEAPKDLRPITDEYTLTCSSAADMNKIYIIFSPNMFTKAIDQDAVTGDVALPRNLSFENFQKWLFSCRKRDKSMSVDTREIIIKRR